MDFIPRFFRKAWIFIRREKFRGELAEEMAFHREQTEKDFQTHDVPSEAAKYAARRKFGKVAVWDVATGKRITEVGDEFDVVLAADIAPDQKAIALGGPAKMLRVF